MIVTKALKAVRFRKKKHAYKEKNMYT